MEKEDSFPQRVWQIVAAIPEGYVTTYGDVAKLAGSPRAARQAEHRHGLVPRRHAHTRQRLRGVRMPRDAAVAPDRMDRAPLPQIETHTDAAGRITKYDYDAQDRLVKHTVADGGVQIVGPSASISMDSSGDISINGGNIATNAAGDETIKVGGSRTESVAKDETISIAGRRTESVAKDETVNTCVLMFRRLHPDDQTIASHLACSKRGRGLMIKALQKIFREDLANGPLDGALRREYLEDILPATAEGIRPSRAETSVPARV